MSIVKKNTYGVDNNLTNMSANVDLNRLGDDKTWVEVDNGTSPATIMIKNGSVIEVNGSAYTIETADYTFQASDATHSYIGFDGTTFTSQATRGVLDTKKQGYYQVDNLTRNLKWLIDQDSEHVSEDYGQRWEDANIISVSDGTTVTWGTDRYSHEYAVSGDDVNIGKNGLHKIKLTQDIGHTGGGGWSVGMNLLVNGSVIANSSSGAQAFPGVVTIEFDSDWLLDEGDVVTIEISNASGGGPWVIYGENPPTNYSNYAWIQLS